MLCYDATKAARLAELVSSGALEPHPVSGEVEIDWDYDAETRYRRIDLETLQALVSLSEQGLAFQLVYCVNDPDGGADGWRIAEVTVAEKPSPFAHFGGASSIAEAERLFHQENSTEKTCAKSSLTSLPAVKTTLIDTYEDDDDDGYWDRYDATPARTPADNRSPAPPPPTAANGGTGVHYGQAAAAHKDDEDDYYAQYDDVQPAMDNHDPDEAAVAAQLNPPASGLSPLLMEHHNLQQQQQQSERRESWEAVASPQPAGRADYGSGVRDRSTSSEDRILLQHPRPESSASSNGSHTVAKLEASAGMQEQSEFGVKQHVSRSIRSLFHLSRSMGISRDEFDQMVKTELDVLGMMEED